MNNDFNKIQSEWYKYRACLFDRATGLPTVNAIIDDIRKELEKEKILGILFLAIGDQQQIEPVFGWEQYDEIVKYFTITVLSEIGKLIPRQSLIGISSISGDGFFIFMNRDSNGAQINKEYFLDLIEKFKIKIEQFKKKDLRHDVMNRVDFHAGYQILHIDPLVRPERLIYQALEEVKYAAYFKEKMDERKRYEELRQIIYKKQITTVYQPIYNLLDDTLYGYEALSRGPAGSYFESPDMIFLYASKGELLMSAEETCLYQAVRNARCLNNGNLLFINITPTLIPSLINDNFKTFLQEAGLNNQHIVLELTEKFAIPDHGLYQRILVNTKGKGYKIALDDVGIGYSTLERISEITPDYLKFDRSLVRDINKNLVRQELAKSFVEFAKKINAIIIAEGIENKEELDFIKSIGINYGQGFLLGCPKSYFD